MRKRTKLADRALPVYSKGEEIMNMVTHIVGGGLGVIALILCVVKAAMTGGVLRIIGAAIYGLCLITLYTMSSVYHGLHPGMGKKVLQVIDHCTIYFLIAGSYTPICLSALYDYSPALGLGVLAVEWILTAIAATLTAIDLEVYNVFSQTCYIAMGWAIVVVLPQALKAISWNGFLFLLLGGIAYTIGAVLYGIGSRVKWMHSVFHIFVVIGSILQFFAIFLYAL